MCMNVQRQSKFSIAHKQTAPFGIVTAQTGILSDGNGYIWQLRRNRILQFFGGGFVAAVGKLNLALFQSAFLQPRYKGGRWCKPNIPVSDQSQVRFLLMC